jgi:hypothetical protein
MHVSGCKTWHTHGAAGRKVAGKSNGPRRNPADRVRARGAVHAVTLRLIAAQERYKKFPTAANKRILESLDRQWKRAMESWEARTDGR